MIRYRTFAPVVALLTIGVVLLQSAIASDVRAQPAPDRSLSKNSPKTRLPSDADHWIPSLAVEGGISFQKWNAGVESLICPGCTFPDPAAEPLQPSGAGDDRDSTALIGIQLELKSPQLNLPGKPRFFVSGEIAPTFGNERDVVSIAMPGEIRSPSASPNAPFSAFIAAGQGAEVTMQRDELTFGASVGLAFPVEAFGRKLEIRPSFNWTRFDVELDGFVSDAECAPVILGGGTPGTQCNTPPNSPNMGFLRATQIRTSTDETFDGIGPGLHIEMEAMRSGPIQTSVFAGTRIYRILGSKRLEIQDGPTTVSDQLGTDQNFARFGFTVDEWVYRFGVGVRVQWVGRDYERRR